MTVETWLEQQRPMLARRAKAFVLDCKEVKGALEELAPTALRTILGAANDAFCIAELELILRYQQGRDIAKWPESLVGGLLLEFQGCIKDSATATAFAQESDRDRAEVRLAVLFLGNVVRLHRYVYEIRQAQRRQQDKR